jgi:hypothetical protein
VIPRSTSDASDTLPVPEEKRSADGSSTPAVNEICCGSVATGKELPLRLKIVTSCCRVLAGASSGIGPLRLLPVTSVPSPASLHKTPSNAGSATRCQ